MSSKDNPSVIGSAWLTHHGSLLDERIQIAPHIWILLAKEKGLRESVGGMVVRLDDFPPEWIRAEAREGSERGWLPWTMQLMLVRWEGAFARRVAVAYVQADAWDAIRAGV